ncbi:MAG: hypothetical protein QNK40_03580 [Desulfobacterales bacterium]|nr:hypothetical protein [Desulfobacterales bacterium]MDX2508465.1 hypothetical protein [Desulfobacterales bacterium]
MEKSNISENERNFLIKLYELTQGNPSSQVSMYDLGEAIGLDRDNALKTAEVLFGFGLAEIKTLAGGIGITEAGLSEVMKNDADKKMAGATVFRLGDAPLIDDTGQKSVEQIISGIKTQTGSLGLDYDSLEELLADLKTIDAQLTSSRPKTKIIRECFQSIIDVLQKVDADELVNQVKGLIQ